MPSKAFIQQLQRLFVHFKRHGGRNIPSGVSQVELVDEDDLTHWFVQLVYKDENGDDFYVAIELVFSEDGEGGGGGGGRGGGVPSAGRLNEYDIEEPPPSLHLRRQLPARPPAPADEPTGVEVSAKKGVSLAATSDAAVAPNSATEGTAAAADETVSSAEFTPVDHRDGIEATVDGDVPSGRSSRPPLEQQQQHQPSAHVDAASPTLRREGGEGEAAAAKEGGRHNAGTDGDNAARAPPASTKLAPSPPPPAPSASSASRTTTSSSARMPLVLIVAPRLLASFIHHGALCSLELMSQVWEQTPDNMVLLLISLHETLNPFSGDGRVSVDDAERVESRRAAVVAAGGGRRGAPLSASSPGTYSVEEHQLGMDYIRRAHPHLFRRHIGPAAAQHRPVQPAKEARKKADNKSNSGDTANERDAAAEGRGLRRDVNGGAAAFLGTATAETPDAASASHPRDAHTQDVEGSPTPTTVLVADSTSRVDVTMTSTPPPPSASASSVPTEYTLRSIAQVNTAVYDALVHAHCTIGEPSVHSEVQQQQEDEEEGEEGEQMRQPSLRMRLDAAALLTDARGDAQSIHATTANRRHCATGQTGHDGRGASALSTSPSLRPHSAVSRTPAMHAERVLRELPPPAWHYAYAATSGAIDAPSSCTGRSRGSRHSTQCVAELWIPRTLPALPTASSSFSFSPSSHSLAATTLTTHHHHHHHTLTQTASTSSGDHPRVSSGGYESRSAEDTDPLVSEANASAAAAASTTTTTLDVTLVGGSGGDERGVVACVLRNARVSVSASRVLTQQSAARIGSGGGGGGSSGRGGRSAEASAGAAAAAASSSPFTQQQRPSPFRLSLQPSTAPSPGGDVHLCEIPPGLTLRCEHMFLYGHLRVLGKLELHHCVFVGSITAEESARVTVSHCRLALMPDDRLLRRAPPPPPPRNSVTMKKRAGGVQREKDEKKTARVKGSRRSGESSWHDDDYSSDDDDDGNAVASATARVAEHDSPAKEKGAAATVTDRRRSSKKRERKSQASSSASLRRPPPPPPPPPPPALFYAQRKEGILVLDSSRVEITDDSRLFRLMPEMQPAEPWRSTPAGTDDTDGEEVESDSSLSDHNDKGTSRSSSRSSDGSDEWTSDSTDSSSSSRDLQRSQPVRPHAAAAAADVVVESPPPLAAMMTVLRSLILVSNNGRLRLVRAHVDPGRNTERTIFAEQDAVVDMAYCNVIAAITSAVIVQGCRAYVEHCTFESAPPPPPPPPSSSSSLLSVGKGKHAHHHSPPPPPPRVVERPRMCLGNASRSTGLIVELGGTLTARHCTAQHLYFAFCVIAHSVAHLYHCHAENVVNGYTVDASSATLDGCSANTNHVGVFVLRKAKCNVTDDRCGGLTRRCTLLAAAHEAARRTVLAEITAEKQQQQQSYLSSSTAAAVAERTSRVAALARALYAEALFSPSSSGSNSNDNNDRERPRDTERACSACIDGSATGAATAPQQHIGFYGGAFGLEVRDAALKASGVTLMNARDTALFAVEDSSVELDDCLFWSTTEAEDAAKAAAAAEELDALRARKEEEETEAAATVQRRLDDQQLLHILSGKRKSVGKAKWTPAAEAALAAAVAKTRANNKTAAAAPAADDTNKNNNNTRSSNSGAVSAGGNRSTSPAATPRQSSCGIKLMRATLRARRCLITGFSFGVGAIQLSKATLSECVVAHGLNGFTFDRSTCTLTDCGANTAHVGLFALNGAVVEAIGTPHIVGVSAAHRTPPRRLFGGGVPAVYAGDVYGVECQASEMDCNGITVLRGRDSGFNVYSRSTLSMKKCLVDMSESDAARYVFRSGRSASVVGGATGQKEWRRAEHQAEEEEGKQDDDDHDDAEHDSPHNESHTVSSGPQGRRKLTLPPSTAAVEAAAAAVSSSLPSPSSYLGAAIRMYERRDYRGATSWLDDLRLDVDVNAASASPPTKHTTNERSASEVSERSRSDAVTPSGDNDKHNKEKEDGAEGVTDAVSATAAPAATAAAAAVEKKAAPNDKTVRATTAAVLTSGVKVWSGSRCHAQDSEVRCVTFGFAALGPETSLDAHHCTAKHVVNGFTADGGAMQLTKCSASSNHVGVYVLSHGRCVVRRGSYTAKKYGVECRSGVLSFQGHVKIYGFSRIGLYLYDNAHCEADADSVIDIHAQKQFTVSSPGLKPGHGGVIGDASSHNTALTTTSAAGAAVAGAGMANDSSPTGQQQHHHHHHHHRPPHLSSRSETPSSLPPQQKQLSTLTLSGPEDGADVSDLLPACIALDEATAHLPQAILGGGARCGITCADGATAFIGQSIIHDCALVGVNVFAGAHLTLANCQLECARQYAVVVHVGGVCRITRPQHDSRKDEERTRSGGEGEHEAEEDDDHDDGGGSGATDGGGRGSARVSAGRPPSLASLAAAAVGATGQRLWSALRVTAAALTPTTTTNVLRRFWRARTAPHNNDDEDDVDDGEGDGSDVSRAGAAAASADTTAIGALGQRSEDGAATLSFLSTAVALLAEARAAASVAGATTSSLIPLTKDTVVKAAHERHAEKKSSPLFPVLSVLPRTRAVRQHLHWLRDEPHRTRLPFRLNTLMNTPAGAGGVVAGSAAGLGVSVCATPMHGPQPGCPSPPPPSSSPPASTAFFSSTAAAATVAAGSCSSPLATPMAALPTPLYTAALPLVQPVVVGSCVIRGTCIMERTLLCPTSYLPLLSEEAASRSRSREGEGESSSEGDERVNNCSGGTAGGEEASEEKGESSHCGNETEVEAAEESNDATTLTSTAATPTHDTDPHYQCRRSASLSPSLPTSSVKRKGKTKENSTPGDGVSLRPPSILVSHHGVLSLADCVVDVTVNQRDHLSRADCCPALELPSAMVRCEGPYARLHCEYVRVQQNHHPNPTAAASATGAAAAAAVSVSPPLRHALPPSQSLGAFRLPPIDSGNSTTDEEGTAARAARGSPPCDGASSRTTTPQPQQQQQQCPTARSSSLLSPPSSSLPHPATTPDTREDDDGKKREAAAGLPAAAAPMLAVVLRGGAQCTLHAVGPSLTRWPFSSAHEEAHSSSDTPAGCVEAAEQATAPLSPDSGREDQHPPHSAANHGVPSTRCHADSGLVVCVYAGSLLEASFTAMDRVTGSGPCDVRLVHCALHSGRMPLVHLRRGCRAQLLESQLDAQVAHSPSVLSIAGSRGGSGDAVVRVETTSLLTLFRCGVKAAAGARAIQCVRGGLAEQLQCVLTSMDTQPPAAMSGSDQDQVIGE